jgi:GMP synthase-like glutamine amidotransferase
MTDGPNELGPSGPPIIENRSGLPAPIVDLLGSPVSSETPRVLKPGEFVPIGKRQVTLIRDTDMDFPCLGLGIYVEGDQYDQRAFAKMFVRSLCYKADTPEEADLVVFSGGVDINPEIYGHDKYYKTNMPNRVRDEREMELYLKCRDLGIPMLGVCRGAQLLWALQGGKLIQDLDNHQGEHPMTDVKTGEILQSVSSVHHQACLWDGTIGADLLGTSRGAKNRFVCVEGRKDTFKNIGDFDADVEAYFFRDTCSLGVQGHPEYANYHKFTQWTLEQIDSLMCCSPDLDWEEGRLRLKKEFRDERDGLKAEATVPTKMSKIDSDPIVLFNDVRFKQALHGSMSKVFIGHNRAATKGAVNRNNAHPFEYGKIVGSHNGTLTTRSFNDLKKALDDDFAVDSMAIFAAIDRLGIRDTVKLLENGHTSSDGAWSLVWYDREADTINFLRNKHRPMYFAYSEDAKRLYWASEHAIIKAGIEVGEANPDKLYADGQGFKYFETMVDHHYEFSLATLKAGGKKPKMKVTERKARDPVTVSTYSGGSTKPDPFERNTQMGFHRTGTHAGGSGSQNGNNILAMRARRGDEKRQNVITLIGDRQNPFAGVVPALQFEQMAKDGCAWCKKPVNFNDLGLTVIEGATSVLCNECGGDAGLTKVYASPKLVDVYLKV